MKNKIKLEKSVSLKRDAQTDERRCKRIREDYSSSINLATIIDKVSNGCYPDQIQRSVNGAKIVDNDYRYDDCLRYIGKWLNDVEEPGPSAEPSAVNAASEEITTVQEITSQAPIIHEMIDINELDQNEFAYDELKIF
ncbi:unnamed protein product [Adineta steineri]|uniref:Uncharacterized protein n=1 Tax=Adineta steineri TaxID=433720 RepID=A0A819F027_9BILA|nr:unnamed protein product [Adineta steineri]CAF0749789.1 unnamed protein product [Adineta steineri]CAF3823508.1 unnamed protein product [Adineta steineri]CAF3859426.1 unnamed protein product [Adineta steineri]